MAERRKLGVVFIVCAVAAIIVVGGALWRLSRDGGAGPAGNDAIVTVIFALAGLAAALAFIWVRIDLRVLSPLERLQRELDTILQSAPDRPVELAAPGVLVPLIARIDQLVTRADMARRDVASSVAAATGQLADERERLAAILRNLSEGVIVCTTDHRVLLFNDAARRTLAAEERLGLGRPIFDALGEDALRQAFAQLSGEPGDPYRPVEIEIEIEARATGETHAARMAAVVDLNGTVEGYVLSFAGTMAAERPSRSRPIRPRRKK
jgi:DNA polymerase-3 subunit epsilon